MKKKGVSPVMATIILIAIVVILAIIIFLWAKGFVGERAQKFGSAIELSCDKTNFEIGFPSNNGCLVTERRVDILNKGNVPIYGIVIKEKGSAKVEVKAFVKKKTIITGNSETFCFNDVLDSNKEVLVIPVLLGETQSGKISHTCGDQYGIAAMVS
tara:strand:+ start:641 stop:1108 length:468 start_codon:yes stop_codon:yes gene_type:complete